MDDKRKETIENLPREIIEKLDSYGVYDNVAESSDCFCPDMDKGISHKDYCVNLGQEELEHITKLEDELNDLSEKKDSKLKEFHSIVDAKRRKDFDNLWSIFYAQPVYVKKYDMYGTITGITVTPSGYLNYIEVVGFTPDYEINLDYRDGGNKAIVSRENVDFDSIEFISRETLSHEIKKHIDKLSDLITYQLRNISYISSNRYKEMLKVSYLSDTEPQPSEQRIFELR